jgi:hypothetical protein
MSGVSLLDINNYMKLDLSKFKEQLGYFFSYSKVSYVENKPIANILFLFLLVGLILWGMDGKAEDFGLNFFTEILGVFITVLIVDQIVQKREEQKTLPHKLAAYEDVRLFVSRYLSFWLSTYKLSVAEKAPDNIRTFFSENGMGKIWNCLYLNSKPNVTPETTWWVHLPNSMKELQDLGDKILDRHSGHLDPEIYGELHHMTESSFLNVFKYMQSIKQSDLNSGFPRPNLLSSYSMQPQKQDYEAMIKLFEWCTKSYERISPHSPYLKKVSEYIPAADSGGTPRCMIPPEVLLKEAETLRKYREQQKQG